MQAAIDQLRAEGYPVLEEDIARLNPHVHDHINMLGRPRRVTTLEKPIGSGSLTRLSVPLPPSPRLAEQRRCLNRHWPPRQWAPVRQRRSYEAPQTRRRPARQRHGSRKLSAIRSLSTDFRD